jgi:hypothetical protein
MLYKNGNAIVLLCPNGTKIRYIPDGEVPQPVKPESIDIKITDRCYNKCWFCYEHSNSAGKHGDLNHPLLDTLEAGTELAIGGGNPLTHPQLYSFLKRMKSKGVVCNLTVHQNDYQANQRKVDRLVRNRLIHGLGISFGGAGLSVSVSEEIKERVVLHAIIGITPLPVILEESKQYKILLLGSKTKPVIDEMAADSLRFYLANYSKYFKGIYFDNLACAQLDVRSLVDKETWEQHYMGNDGMFTMFIDLVQGCGYVSSINKSNGFSLSESTTIRELFDKVRQSVL